MPLQNLLRDYSKNLTAEELFDFVAEVRLAFRKIEWPSGLLGDAAVIAKKFVGEIDWNAEYAALLEARKTTTVGVSFEEFVITVSDDRRCFLHGVTGSEDEELRVVKCGRIDHEYGVVVTGFASGVQRQLFTSPSDAYEYFGELTDGNKIEWVRYDEAIWIPQRNPDLRYVQFLIALGMVGRTTTRTREELLIYNIDDYFYSNVLGATPRYKTFAEAWDVFTGRAVSGNDYLFDFGGE